MQTTRRSALLAIVLFALAVTHTLFSPPLILAQTLSCENFTNIQPPLPREWNLGEIDSLEFTLSNLSPNAEYVVYHKKSNVSTEVARKSTSSSGNVSFNITNAIVFTPFSQLWIDKNQSLVLSGPGVTDNNNQPCDLHTYLIKGGKSCQSVKIYQMRTDESEEENKCYSCLQENMPIQVEVRGLKEGLTLYQGPVEFFKNFSITSVAKGQSDANGNIVGTVLIEAEEIDQGDHTLFIKKNGADPTNFCSVPLSIKLGCSTECKNDSPPDSIITSKPFDLCDQIPASNLEMRRECEECAGGPTGQEGIWTAVGCIKREPTSLVASLIQLGLGAAGGVALLMILAAGFMLTTSQGDPKKAGDAKEMITAAVVGLLFVIFSVTILQFIGYTVLQIPGFGG